MARLRTFIAIEATDQIRSAGARLIQKLSHLGPGVRWVNPENIHLTLKFLGEVDERQLHQVCRQLGEAARECTAFSLRCGGVGAFPSLTQPRTIWMGVEDQEGRLAQLQQRAESSLVGLGFPPEARRYHGHLTLGRIRYNRRDSSELQQLIDAEAKTEFGILAVDEVVVFASSLSRGGPTYTAIGRCALGN